MEEQRETWRLCWHCIQAIRSRGEPLFVGEEVYEDEDDPTTYTCEWCEDEFVTVYECL